MSEVADHSSFRCLARSCLVLLLAGCGPGAEELDGAVSDARQDVLVSDTDDSAVLPECIDAGEMELQQRAFGGRLWLRIDAEPAQAGLSIPASVERAGARLREFELIAGMGALSVEAEAGDTLCVRAGMAVRRVEVPEAVLPQPAVLADGAETTLGGVVELPESLVVPAGHTLRMEPGTVLWMLAGVELRVEGELVALGTAFEPILIAGEDSARFGSVLVRGTAQIENAFISGGGAGPWTFSAHRHCCRAMLRAEGPVQLDRVSFVDTPRAKGLIVESVDAEVTNTVFSNLGFGSEYFTPAGSSVRVEHSIATEMRGPDDSDGFYVWERGNVVLRDLHVFGVDDDGIDGETTNAMMQDITVRNARDRCLSLTSSSATIEGALLAGCDVGVKFDVRPDRLQSRPTVRYATIADITTASVLVSARYGDGTPDGDIQPIFERTVIGPGALGLETDYTFDEVQLRQSLVPTAFPAVTEEEVVRGEALFEGASDYRLRTDSPGADLSPGFFARP